MPKISVLMPYYNTKEEWLKEAIESILNQTFQDFELIIIDDGSKEDITNIINSYNDKRIKLYKNDNNLGVSKTRNKLINLALGEYIAFQDSDDISLPTRLEKQTEFLDKNDEYFAVGSYAETFPNGKIKKQIQNPKIIDFLGGCPIFIGTSMLRLKDFKKYNLKFNEKYKTSEDYDLWARVIPFLKVTSLQEVLLKYRRNNSSLTHTMGNAIEKIDTEIKQNILNNLTDNKVLQKKIINLVTKYYSKKLSLSEKIFSIRNIWQGNKKNKCLTIFGINIKLPKEDKLNAYK